MNEPKDHTDLPPHHLTTKQPIFVRKNNHRGSIVGTAFPCISWHNMVSIKLNVKISNKIYAIPIPRALLEQWLAQADTRFHVKRVKQRKHYEWQVRRG